MIDRILWRLWLNPRPLSWDRHVPLPLWNWWIRRLTESASRPDIVRMLKR